MEQFVLVPAFVYNNNNKKFNIPAVAKQELPKYQGKQFPTYQIDSLKKEINKKLFAKADSSVDKILSCPHIKLSESQNLKLNGVGTAVLLSDFAQQFRRKNSDVPDIYFNLLETAGISATLVLNENAEAKERESRFPFKNERQKL